MPVVSPTPPMPQHLQATPATTRTKTESLHSHTISKNSLLPKAVLIDKSQIIRRRWMLRCVEKLLDFLGVIGKNYKMLSLKESYKG